MSQLENAAKPILTKLQAAERFSLDPDDQTVVLQWIVLKMMVAEHSRRDQAIFPQAARTAFMETREAPALLNVWLFRSGDGRWRSGYARCTTDVQKIPASQLGKVAEIAPLSPNVKSVAFGFNQLFIYSNFTVVPDFILGNEFERLGFRLWPKTTETINWPPEAVLREDVATAIAEIILRLPQVSPA